MTWSVWQQQAPPFIVLWQLLWEAGLGSQVWHELACAAGGNPETRVPSSATKLKIREARFMPDFYLSTISWNPVPKVITGGDLMQSGSWWREAPGVWRILSPIQGKCGSSSDLIQFIHFRSDRSRLCLRHAGLLLVDAARPPLPGPVAQM